MKKPMKRTQHGIICSSGNKEENGKFSIELRIAIGLGKPYKEVRAEIDYREWATIHENIPVCEPFDKFKKFCDRCFNTTNKKKELIEKHLKFSTGDLKSDYYDTIATIWSIRYNEAIEKSRKYFWEIFIEKCINSLIDELIHKAENVGFIISKDDIIKSAIPDYYIKYVKKD